jgi:nucleoside phosphorylase
MPSAEGLTPNFNEQKITVHVVECGDISGGGHMAIDAEWARRNLGISLTGSTPSGALDSPADGGDDRQLQRQLIDFDSQGPSGAAFQGQATQTAIGLSHFVPIPWPEGFAPTAGSTPTGDSLPKADVLIVTWTVDEGHGLSQVLTPGVDSHSGWKNYTKNFEQISKTMSPVCPARQAGRLGTYWTTQIGTQRVTLFKSDSHMSQDGPKLANAVVWKQIIEDCRPSWVITTGTGGGIGPDLEVGDVIVSRFVSFDCQKQFKKLNGESYACQTQAPSEKFAMAGSLFDVNSPMLPKDNSRPPKIFSATAFDSGILTTDFFGFDNTANTYGLEGKGDLSEMGDAVLGMVCQDLGGDAPSYVVVRNVSDPQIDSAGLTLEAQTKLAAGIYQGYGLWSTICSAIVCWAIVAGL